MFLKKPHKQHDTAYQALEMSKRFMPPNHLEPVRWSGCFFTIHPDDYEDLISMSHRDKPHDFAAIMEDTVFGESKIVFYDL